MADVYPIPSWVNKVLKIPSSGPTVIGKKSCIPDNLFCRTEQEKYFLFDKILFLLDYSRKFSSYLFPF